MKSSVIYKNRNNLSYPCLKYYVGKDIEFTVLFTEKDKGFVVHDVHNTHGIGATTSILSGPDGCWDEESFLPFENKIILENTF